jgi:AcrR family transcriptional regulator
MVQTAAVATARLEPGSAADGRRREILAAASRLFRARGLHATGMREIAAELGMTAGNLYYYFPSKQDLLAYCQEATLAELLALVERSAAGRGRAQRPARSAAMRLREILVGHVVALNQSTPGSLAHLEIEEVPPGRRKSLLAGRRRYESSLRRLLVEGMRSGELRTVDPRLATLALLGALNWTVKWFDPSGPKSAREVGESIADLLLAGIASPTAAKRLGARPTVRTGSFSSVRRARRQDT